MTRDEIIAGLRAAKIGYNSEASTAELESALMATRGGVSVSSVLNRVRAVLPEESRTAQVLGTTVEGLRSGRVQLAAPSTPASTRRTVEDVVRNDNFRTTSTTSRGGGGMTTQTAETLGFTTNSGGRSVPVNPSETLGSLGNTAVGIGCGYITNPQARAACIALGGAIADRVLGNRGGSTTTERTMTGQENCPPGYKKDGNGVCRVDTLGGGRFPGDVGRADTVWNPVAGLYGVGVTPVLVQTAKRACPAGFVLGKDGICYESLSRGQRAHNPGARPLLTGGEMNAMRTAARVQKKLKKAAGTFVKKPCSCSTRSRSRKKS